MREKKRKIHTSFLTGFLLTCYLTMAVAGPAYATKKDVEEAQKKRKAWRQKRKRQRKL